MSDPFSQQDQRHPATRYGRWLQRAAATGYWLQQTTLNLAFPRSCPVCHGAIGEEQDVIVCEQCRCKLTAGNVDPCPRCADPNYVDARLALPKLADSAAARIGPVGCLKCHDLSFRFQRAMALGAYEHLLRDVAIRMKHTNEERLTLAIGHLLGEQINARNYADQIDVILPIPIHWFRRYTRQYNVSEILARGIARQSGLVQCDRLLKSIRRTEKQGTLTVHARRENVKGAFGLSSHYELNDAHVMLIDDVMTTGSTLSEAARVCLQGGAATVRVAVAVRAAGYG